MALKRGGLITSQRAWAIVHNKRHTLLHTNWLTGLDQPAWPGMFERALFGTRQEARDALRALKSVLPSTWRVEGVELSWFVTPAKRAIPMLRRVTRKNR